MSAVIVVELVTLVAGLAALVAMCVAARRYRRSDPGDAVNLRAQSTIWASSGVLIMAGANAMSVLIGPGDVRLLLIGVPLAGVATWCFVHAFRLRRLAG